MNLGVSTIKDLCLSRLNAERGLDRLISWATRLSRGRAWVVTALAVVLAGWADRVTGPEISFGPLYLLIVCLPAWALGWRAAMLVGLACAGVSIAANGMNIYPLGQLAIAWNLAMRMLSAAIIVVLMSGIRRSFDREWLRARRDELTGLLNRAGFENEFDVMLCDGKDITIFFMDLDDFKTVNDTYGHAYGDLLLQETAKRLVPLARGRDLVARIGGDEFVIASQRADFCPSELADAIVTSVGETWYDLGIGLTSVGVSVGVARSSVYGRDLTSLLEAADAALYDAKAQGRARFIIARPPLQLVESVASSGRSSRLQPFKHSLFSQASGSRKE
jgi:diguanylate cyclase (GGDEF)-like protein